MPDANQRSRARPKPFMEHPTGEFKNSIEAMADAIQRLRTLPEWNEWITFCAQGAGQNDESYHLGEIRMRRDLVYVGRSLNITVVAHLAQVEESVISGGPESYNLSAATPLEAARILDAIYRNDLGIRPFPNEGKDYAVGAEW